MRSVAVFMLPLLAAALHSDQSSLIRRQNEVQLGAGGDMMRAQARPSMQEVIASRAKGPVAPEHVVHDLCDYNYVVGAAGQSNCTDSATQSVMEEESMCEAAAKKLTGASCDDGSCLGDPFMKTGVDFNKFPKSCFKTADGKWYYNPSPYWPTAAEATAIPVCVTVEFLNGTLNTDDCGSDEYENIVDQDECRTCATCLTKMQQPQFRVEGDPTGTGSADFPKGCHIMGDGATVQFNKRVALLQGGTTTPVGTPLCKLKTTAA